MYSMEKRKDIERQKRLKKNANEQKELFLTKSTRRGTTKKGPLYKYVACIISHKRTTSFMAHSISSTSSWHLASLCFLQNYPRSLFSFLTNCDMVASFSISFSDCGDKPLSFDGNNLLCVENLQTAPPSRIRKSRKRQSRSSSNGARVCLCAYATTTAAYGKYNNKIISIFKEKVETPQKKRTRKHLMSHHPLFPTTLLGLIFLTAHYLYIDLCKHAREMACVCVCTSDLFH